MKARDFYPPLFSRYAEQYQRRHRQLDRHGLNQARRWLQERIAPQPGERILDLACGPGRLTRRFAQAVGRHGEVVGVDMAPRMLELATRAVSRGRFLRMDMQRLAFADAAFDAAACGHGLHFCADLPAALGEARRVLREGGRYAASVPVGAPTDPAWRELSDVLAPHLAPEPEVVDNRAAREVVRDLDAFRAAARMAGLRNITAERIVENTVWRNAGHYVTGTLNWWSLASRLEHLDGRDRAELRREAIARLRASLGDGPIEQSGADHVIYAER